MDQLKEYLQVASKHRFWIAIGLASLFPLIAYFVGTGALAEQAKTEEGKIKQANDGAKAFLNGTVPNGDWKNEVEKKTQVVAQDVLKSWEKLYSRQEPLLTWPAPVAKTIQEWGPAYPKGVDPQAVNDAILEYTQAYDEYVEDVYKTFEPFDYKTGKGKVAAAPMTALLRPVRFVENKRPPLGDVWAAQRKLWIERTMFDVIKRVNTRAGAKDWDSAAIKQIVLLEVANALALDQKSDKDMLVEAAPILAPGQTAPVEKASTSASSSAAAAMPAGDMGGMGLAGGSAALSAPEPVQFVKSANPDQYFVVPVALDVYIEQDRIPDLLVELRNSPMSIRVLDFEMVTPLTPVKKPRKGVDESTFIGAMGEGRGMMGAGRAGGLLGDSVAGAGGGGAGMMMPGNYNNGAGKAYSDSMASGPRGVMGTGGAKAAKKTRSGGEDRKAENLKKLSEGKKGSKKDAEKEKADEDTGSSLSNPYFNVVEVKIRGQARFYMPPPKVATPAPAPTPNAAPKGDPAKAAPADAKKADAKDAPKADVKDAPKADAKDAPKADTKDAKKAETPKGDVPADSKKADAKDAPKADPAKDASKADDAKDAKPKADDAKDAKKDDPKPKA